MFTVEVEDPETGKRKTLELLCNKKEADQTVGLLRRAGFQVTEPKPVTTK